MYKLGDEMLIRTQPTRWSCVPSAFATVLNMEVETLLEYIGHDGSEIVFDDLPDPLCRRAFQTQELTLVLWKLGYNVVSFDIEPLAFVDPEHVFTLDHLEPEILKIMSESIGVGCGHIRDTEKTHAFAWNGSLCYDPTGFIYPLSRFELYSFHAISKRV